MTFIHNKYNKWYYSIVENAKINNNDPDVYYEKHHILPQSLGGSNSKENLVKLTPREHFVCHLLLTKMTTGNQKYKMQFALSMISNVQNIGEGRYRPSSHLYEYSRKSLLEAHSAYWTNEKKELQSKKAKQDLTEYLKTLTPEERTARVKNSMCAPETYTKKRSKNISIALTGLERSEENKANSKKSAIAHRNSLTITEKKKIYGSNNAGKTWKLVNGKRVWLMKENQNY